MKTPELIREQIILGETPPSRLPEAERAGLESIVASDREILATYPAERMKAEIAARLSKSAQLAKSAQPGKKERPNTASQTAPGRRPPLTFASRRVLTSIMAACACGAIALTAVAIRSSRTPDISLAAIAASETGIRAKGERSKGTTPQLFVYKKVENQVALLSDRDTVAPGDVLQLSYQAGTAKCGAIVSVDGNGIVTQHYPDIGDITARLLPGREVSLDFAYRLDEAPGFERFFFITSDMVVSISSFKDALAEAARNAGGADFPIPDALSPKARVIALTLIK